MPFILPETLESIRQHALAEYPHECCGIIIGKEKTNQEDILFRCANIQNELHQKDPATFVRDARTAFYIDPRELLRIFKETEKRNMALKVFYHSHPEHDAYFSKEDENMALFDGEPVYPGARYLVVSVYNREIKDEALFSWNSARKVFDRQASSNRV